MGPGRRKSQKTRFGSHPFPDEVKAESNRSLFHQARCRVVTSLNDLREEEEDPRGLPVLVWILGICGAGERPWEWRCDSEGQGTSGSGKEHFLGRRPPGSKGPRRAGLHSRPRPYRRSDVQDQAAARLSGRASGESPEADASLASTLGCN